MGHHESSATLGRPSFNHDYPCFQKPLADHWPAVKHNQPWHRVGHYSPSLARVITIANHHITRNIPFTCSCFSNCRRRGKESVASHLALGTAFGQTKFRWLVLMGFIKIKKSKIYQTCKYHTRKCKNTNAYSIPFAFWMSLFTVCTCVWHTSRACEGRSDGAMIKVPGDDTVWVWVVHRCWNPIGNIVREQQFDCKCRWHFRGAQSKNNRLNTCCCLGSSQSKHNYGITGPNH